MHINDNSIFWSRLCNLHSGISCTILRISFLTQQVSVVMWLAPRPSVRESRVQIPSQHGNLVKFILVWVFFNPSGILTQPLPCLPAEFVTSVQSVALSMVWQSVTTQGEVAGDLSSRTQLESDVNTVGLSFQ